MYQLTDDGALEDPVEEEIEEDEVDLESLKANLSDAIRRHGPGATVEVRAEDFHALAVDFERTRKDLQFWKDRAWEAIDFASSTADQASEALGISRDSEAKLALFQRALQRRGSSAR